MRASASTFTISQDGPYVAVDPNLSVGTADWRLNTHATANTNTNGTASNSSLVFAYTDAQNYYYANFATTTGTGLSGVYRVSSGVRSTISTFGSQYYVNAGQQYEFELRYSSNAVKVYLGTTMVYKVTNVTANGTKVGVATVNGNASFDNTYHLTGTTTTNLNLSFDGSGGGSTPTAPTVSVTAPANNATVSGPQTVTANAADAVAVTSVQFKLDGNNLGSADTTAPYSANWDTTTASNGSHSITAVATNQAALTTTSSAVAVTVSNQTTPPPAADYTVHTTGPNAGIDTTRSTASASTWRFSSHITPVAGNGTSPANASLVFNYTDDQNFYYVNFATQNVPGAGLSGAYRVTNGVAYKLLALTNYVTDGTPFDLELRYADNAVKIYLNGTYLTKANDITGTGDKLGVFTSNAEAGFSSTQVLLGTTTYPLTLTDSVLVATPDNPYVCLPTPSNPVRTTSTGRQVAVSTSAQLKAAILDAQPGDTITMADGIYADTMTSGNYNASFAATADGTAANPITLTGGPGALIDGNGPSGRYGFYLNGANYWNLVGFTVANASKGILLDGSSHNFLENMHVSNVGDEAVHFRAFSSDNVIKNSQISGTGKSSEQFGEGVYIGSASGANWGIHTGGLPDTSDRNIVIGNTFSDFTAEGIDVKEGTSSNYIANNTFEGSSLSGQNSADSWIDLKGRCNFVENNVGTNTLLDGFQVHNVYQNWASYNLFRNNVANVNNTGYGFALDYNSLGLGNLVECNNVVTGAGSGFSNVACTQQYF
jgi:parallel beta-helix repeat protein